MNRTEKQQLVDELHEELAGLAPRGPRGLPGPQRPRGHRVPQRRCGASGSRYRVVKNSLALRAAKGTPLEKLESKLEGTTGIAYTGDDPVALAKVLVDFAKDNPALVRQGGRRVRQPGARRRGRQGPQHDAEPARAAGAGCSACCRRRPRSWCACSGTPAHPARPGAEGAPGQARRRSDGLRFRTGRLRKSSTDERGRRKRWLTFRQSRTTSASSPCSRWRSW